MKIEGLTMQELTQYVARTNLMRNLFGDLDYDLNNVVHRRNLANDLERDLSPENVSCDGEVRGIALQQKVNHLRLVQKQLAFLEEHEMKHAMLMGGAFPIGDYNG